MPTDFKLPRIYPITDTRISGISHLEQIELLARGGASLVQIRDKSATSRELFESVRVCLEHRERLGIKLIVNDRVDIAMLLGADGVHLGQDDLPPAEARKILGPKAIIGFSTHTLEQALDAVSLPINYIAFGPIYEPRSKADHEAVVGLEKLREVRKSVGSFPLAAIGGIDFENMGEVFSAGADSVAMISALVSDPSRVTETMRNAVSK